MPNTKSAEHRVRSSERRHFHNQSIKSRLKTLEKAFLGLTATGKKAFEAYIDRLEKLLGR